MVIKLLLLVTSIDPFCSLVAAFSVRRPRTTHGRQFPFIQSTLTTLRPTKGTTTRPLVVVQSSIPSWSELEDELGDCYRAPTPRVIDSVLQPESPTFSTSHPTLFRERHGWCPYSERVWLTLELLETPYDTILIDNSGGPRPNYYSGGQTPQIQWPDEGGRRQGESLDLVQRLDQDYSSSTPHVLQSNQDHIQHVMNQFRSIFPSRARPSSRAAFLFQGNGEPLFRSTFEQTLEKTNQLLSESSGPFLTGSTLTAADIAWVPFLERYRYQLPILHQGLCPYDPQVYPHLCAWYQAMDQLPAYACQVKGNASSWRKVLLMAGFGNAGMVPPQITQNVQDQEHAEQQKLDHPWTSSTSSTSTTTDMALWQAYASTRPHVAVTPRAHVAQIICRNRHALVTDTLKQQARGNTNSDAVPSTEDDLDETLRELVQVLLDEDEDGSTLTNHSRLTVGAMASFLLHRMCVPRDMGAVPAASLQQVAWQLQTYN